jgi:hypothetical protein
VPPVQVKCTLYRYGHLLFRPRQEIEGELIVLCVERVLDPSRVGAVGWITRQEFLQRHQTKDLGGYGASRTMELYDLHTMHSFPLTP